MPIFAIGDKVPAIHPTAFIAPTATIVGDVTIHANASVWYNATVRGDMSRMAPWCTAARTSRRSSGPKHRSLTTPSSTAQPSATVPSSATVYDVVT